MYDELIETYRKLNDSLKVSVKIDHGEQFKLIVKDLIQKRNCSSNKVRPSFDDVLRQYLGDEDFNKYVINGEELNNI